MPSTPATKASKASNRKVADPEKEALKEAAEEEEQANSLACDVTDHIDRVSHYQSLSTDQEADLTAIRCAMAKNGRLGGLINKRDSLAEGKATLECLKKHWECSHEAVLLLCELVATHHIHLSRINSVKAYLKWLEEEKKKGNTSAQSGRLEEKSLAGIRHFSDLLNHELSPRQARIYKAMDFSGRRI